MIRSVRLFLKRWVNIPMGSSNMQTIKRIVMVESTNDKVAHNRMSKIQNTAALKNFSVFFVFAVDQSVESLPPGALTRAFSFGEDIPLATIEEKLFSRIMNQVTHSDPQLILIYTGFVFKQFYNDYYRAIKRIKKHDPEILFGRFGADMDTAQDAPSGIFDRTKAVQAIETLFLKHVLDGRSKNINKLKFYPS